MHNDYEAMSRIVKSNCIASFTFLVWETLVTSGDEVEYIWPKPTQSFFKWLYFFLRYFNMLAQLWHQFAIPRIISGHISNQVCKAWYIYTIIITQAMATAVEIILATRVYALYNKSRRVGGLLYALILIEIIAMTANSIHTIPIIEHAVICVLVKPPQQILYYSISVFTTQSALMGLTLIKHFFAMRNGWGRTPLVSLLMRDGIAVYLVMFVLIASTVIYCLSGNELTVIVFFWLLSLLSSTGCRLIVNMQRLATMAERHSTSGVQLSTEIALDVSCPTLE
ncbi:hypothetical protein SERLA73DRAFT_176266 [Serpula lacrymans var. lacrymans S7.3]|uniref:DUF6533 domain-containing protein n=2 Tax=Serpula lacrymans var. lacrymans TaxID=341189 RepID=F8PML1_SERL3|nr:uncharacterized protein SERLADRAFT_459071 [Serpula lacrymans var. lacrymans S7.9]EGO02843.1 hypothetical protein SERLA73DRAFT_176266 [Serpula lacrymans var. lacrymans S7.3]EGO28539.1 hypothetical protein SERLADRAFT_459071 [Serpula lacrymans var. lacrymans S7.9]